jgi:cytoplasmic iron level regulating protein YaaA (DUF328/UPF0246 family)
MLTLLSPAKTLDFETPATTDTCTQADFLDHSAELVDVLKPYSPDDIGALMKLSPALSELNVQRYHDWQLPFSADNAKAAMLAFKGVSTPAWRPTPSIRRSWNLPSSTCVFSAGCMVCCGRWI